MGYMKDKLIDQQELDWFMDCAKTGDIDWHYPNLEGELAERNMPIDTRGNFEEQMGLVYTFGDVQVFVPEHIFMLVQPIVEPLPLNSANSNGHL